MPDHGGEVRLVDDLGDTTRLARPAGRIVSLSPSVTELLFSIGAGSAVVGRTQWDTDPPEATAVPSVGDGLAPNVEAVLAARPDLVVLYAGGANASAVGQLRAAAVPAVQLRVDRMADWARAARLLGRATGRDSAAGALVAEVEAQLRGARVAMRAPLRVAVVVGVHPPIVIGGGSFLGEIVEAAGGRNAFGDIALASAPVSLESIAARDPDLIITLGPAPPGAFARAEWQSVRAVRDGRVIALDGSRWSWPSARTPGAVRELAAILSAAGP